MDALFPPRYAPDDAQDAAIAQVCARLELPREWPADDGYEHAIVGGAIDGERTAWIERRSRAEDGWEDVDYCLRTRAGDTPLREWTVETYNPYFGCRVGYMRWWGEEVVAIYREKHRTIACALGPTGAPHLRVLSDRWRVHEDIALHESDARGLVERVRLPQLTPLAPLPRAAAAEQMSLGSYIHSPPWPTDPAALQREIAARLPALPEPLAELLIGALAYRFWDDWPPPAATYDTLAPRRWNPPCWLPFYCHHASDRAAARALLAHLDALAARPPAACDAEDLAAELACRHISDRCRELAAACRAGHLPEETSCYFWAEWSQAAFAGSRSLFPAGLWAAWTDLRPRARELYALGTGAPARC